GRARRGAEPRRAPPRWPRKGPPHLRRAGAGAEEALRQGQALAPRARRVVLVGQVKTSAYVHFPWCLEKCPYCDFNSHKTAAGEVPHEAYADAVLRELEARS